MLPKMRTIKELYQTAKEQDPKTKLSYSGIRRLIITGQLPSVRVGTKYLVSLEVFEEFLKGKPQTTADNSENSERVKFDKDIAEIGILNPQIINKKAGVNNGI